MQEIFNYEGAAGASFILSSLTTSKGITDASTAEGGGTTITNMLELLKPVAGEFVGLTAKGVLITVEIGSVNMCLDGSTPTVATETNLGHRLDAGQSYVIRGKNAVKNCRFINREADNGALIKGTVFYYGGD